MYKLSNSFDRRQNRRTRDRAVPSVLDHWLTTPPADTGLLTCHSEGLMYSSALYYVPVTPPSHRTVQSAGCLVGV